MKRHTPLWLVFSGALLFALLFHMKAAGINLLIFNIFIVGSLIASKRIVLRNFHHMILACGTILTIIFSIITHSGITITMNYISLILLSAASLFPETRSLIDLGGISFLNIFYSFKEFFKKLFNLNSKSVAAAKTWKIIKIIFIPIIIIIIFIAIYRAASPWFDQIASNVFNSIGTFIFNIFGEIDWWWLGTFILGLCFVIFLLLGKAHPGIVNYELNAKDILFRRRRNYKYHGKFTALKTEYRSAIILLISLNLLLLLVNILDIKNVWFGFEWNGDFLKQFVHEGTWLLIFSILISIGIILFYFRKNLNFIKNNRRLKQLAILWMTQNFILVISVAIRNIHYIDYFNLAYKRIGIMFFLLAVLIGIVTVILKIINKHTTFFLLRYNALSIYSILIIMGFTNWDVFIAQYNFEHADSAFLHLNYMQSLDDKALPWLEKDINELVSIKEKQAQQFDFSEDYMTAELYYETINNRCDEFIIKHESQSWLSWNFAEHKAYKILIQERKE
jgi:hypothetical protein